MTVNETRTHEAIQSMSRKMRDQNRIDWEKRKWELASKIFLELNLDNSRRDVPTKEDAELAIERAEEFIKEYKQQSQPKEK